MIDILVTGSEGQLGRSIAKIAGGYPDFRFDFKNSRALDITSKSEVTKLFSIKNYDYCINCAAYTDVEAAESHGSKAFAVNAEGVRHLAKNCRKRDTVLIHISTDYVFDGEKEGAYEVDDTPNPINVYGKSKLQGEAHVKELLSRYFIVRTSWLYSDYGQNFYRTILRLSKTESELNITDKQRGCPTHAPNLAKYILNIIAKKRTDYGLLHFTDKEAMTWYDFAVRIIDKEGLAHKVKIKKADNYVTFARRPKNSVLAQSS